MLQATCLNRYALATKAINSGKEKNINHPRPTQYAWAVHHDHNAPRVQSTAYLLSGIGSRCIILSIRVTSILRVILALCPALSPLLHLQARVSAVRVMRIEC